MPRFRCALAVLLAGAVPATTVGCGEEAIHPRPVVTPPSTVPTADESTSDAATMTVDGRGGSATLTIRVGAPEPAGSVSDPGAAACAGYLERTGQDEGAIAVPITVSGQGSGPLVARLGGLAEVVNGEVESRSYSGVMFGVKYTGFAPQCDRDLDAGTVRWEDGAGSWSTWIVVPASSTASGDAGSMLIAPKASVGSGFGGTVELDGGPSSPVVRCGETYDDELPPTYIALDREWALENGCVTLEGEETRPITNAICSAAFPDGDRFEDDDGTVTYDRDGSLRELCKGFGLRDETQITPGMQCAFVAGAAAADATVRPLDGLCNTEELLQAFKTGDWTGVAATVACGAFGSVLVHGVSVAAATRFAKPSVGVGTYRVMAPAVATACNGIQPSISGLLDYFESRHHGNVRNDVLREGKCLRVDAGGDPEAIDC